ncbi:hypothetical protein PTSG_01663 [Salpingoeca rosetta]|uniref:Sulfotransferase domain-containing protein n=1 Tax=Salpingoeca rosetta (strain ATCC 50818 / BSB-021) TaxID=946362 RepID=F2TYK9_SALR5|nr:uncharacterized protein PTSG_01663 [Salpingoeca rosetta]EGD78683.1 hypothetical protein PTSG_01663 [Salpingoeca rosetta]|eukprot:XP_004997640.1 hypothetical protein PTSG_01663 [Salpingoeca rosetta]
MGKPVSFGEVAALIALVASIACLLYAHASVSVGLAAIDATAERLGLHELQQGADGVAGRGGDSDGRRNYAGGTQGHGGAESRGIRIDDAEDVQYGVVPTKKLAKLKSTMAKRRGSSEAAALARKAIAGRFWEEDNICLHSHKLLPGCPFNGQVPLLVTGVGRSGTHHIASALRMKGLDICHEAVCSQGSVSWTYAVVDPDHFYPWEASKRRINNQRFQQVFHVVRHPLRCVASLTTFTGLSWRFIGKHTPQVPDLATMQPVLRRALIHWVTWNRMVEVYADRRFRMEDTMPADVCRAAGFEENVCSKRINRAARAKRHHTTVTWEDLYRVDAEFTRAAMRLAHKYGYEDARHVVAGDDDDAGDDEQ